MISIAAVVATAIMTVLSMRGTYESLVYSRDTFYEDSRFPEVWANLERAPETLRSQIRNIEGVSATDTRVTFMANLSIETLNEPATGLFVSIERHEDMLGKLHLRSGRFVESADRDQAVVSEKFAGSHGFTEGDQIQAVINGQLRSLEIVGIAISPEHMYPLAPGSIFPDDTTFGIIWMGRGALSSLYDMEGAFNEVVLTLSAHANEERVKVELDDLLKAYGGQGSYGRPLQISHQFLENELNQNRTTGTMIPAVFLAVVAFLLNIVLRRLIATQRQEIAVLKAFGYSNGDIGMFYFQYALVAVLAGAVVGVVIGAWLGEVMVEMYKQFFVFPDLAYRLSPGLVIFALGVSAAAASLGALGGMRRAVALPPAEAMRPQAPARFKPGIVERIGLGKHLSSAARMVVRNIERRPMKSVFSALGVSFSVAILVVGMFMFDAVDYMMELQFGVIQREDVSVSFNRPLSQDVEYELLRIDGVMGAEVFRAVPVRFRNGHLKREAGITGRHQDDELQRIVTESGEIIPLPLEGLVISRYLADELNITQGERINVEVLEGSRRVESILVIDIVDDFLGVSAYMEIGALHRLVGGARSVSGANLKLVSGTRERVSTTLSDLPAVAGVSNPGKMYESFKSQMDQGLLVGVLFLVGFSSIIAVAVIYNGARIALSERGRELASLRVLGFTKQEVAILLFSEQGLITLVSIPIGWYLGYLLADATVSSLVSETYRMPLIVDSGTFAISAVITIIAAIGSSLIVRRRLNNYDLISVLKTRD